MSKVTSVSNKDHAFRDILNAVARGTREGYAALNFAFRTVRVQDNLNAICADLDDLYGEVAKHHMILVGDHPESEAFLNAEAYFVKVLPDITRTLNRVRQNALKVAEFRRTGRISR